MTHAQHRFHFRRPAGGRDPGGRRVPHPAYLLGLGFALAMGLAVDPSTAPHMQASLIDLPIESTTEFIGPRCPLTAWEPSRGGNGGIWVLPAQRQVLPYELVAAGYPENLQRAHDVIAEVTCTAYSSTRGQTDSTPFLTASMQPVGPGIIALSRDLLRRYTAGAPFDFGDYVEVVGLGVFRVEDTMHRRWRQRADLWVRSRAEARRWGRRQVLIGALPADREWTLFEHSPAPVAPRSGFEVQLVEPAPGGPSRAALVPPIG